MVFLVPLFFRHLSLLVSLSLYYLDSRIGNPVSISSFLLLDIIFIFIASQKMKGNIQTPCKTVNVITSNQKPKVCNLLSKLRSLSEITSSSYKSKKPTQYWAIRDHIVCCFISLFKYNVKKIHEGVEYGHIN